MKKKEIVILGAGFAGISTYLSLQKSLRKKHNITIINNKNYFLFIPLIHELATGALATHHVTEPIRKIIDIDTRFIQSKVTSIDIDKKRGFFIIK